MVPLALSERDSVQLWGLVIFIRLLVAFLITVVLFGVV